MAARIRQNLSCWWRKVSIVEFELPDHETHGQTQFCTQARARTHKHTRTVDLGLCHGREIRQRDHKADHKLPSISPMALRVEVACEELGGVEGCRPCRAGVCWCRSVSGWALCVSHLALLAVVYFTRLALMIGKELTGFCFHPLAPPPALNRILNRVHPLLALLRGKIRLELPCVV